MTQENGMCQSCGMPMSSTADHGSESDGSLSPRYCHYCYQNGMFTDPDITLDLMVDRVASVMEQMFEIPSGKGKEFSRCQLQNLYRWSGRMIPVCESCGMPLINEQDAGTEKDGSKTTKYCTHCYQSGVFTDPDLTRETMINKYAPMLSTQLEMPIPKAKEMVRRFTATLPRWK